MGMCRGSSDELVVGQASSVGKRPTMPAAARLGLVYTCNTNLGTLGVGCHKVPGRGSSWLLTTSVIVGQESPLKGT